MLESEKKKKDRRTVESEKKKKDRRTLESEKKKKDTRTLAVIKYICMEPNHGQKFC